MHLFACVQDLTSYFFCSLKTSFCSRLIYHVLFVKGKVLIFFFLCMNVIVFSLCHQYCYWLKISNFQHTMHCVSPGYPVTGFFGNKLFIIFHPCLICSMDHSCCYSLPHPILSIL